MIVERLRTTFSYETYTFKYARLCPTLQTKFKSAQFKNLQYSMCFIAFVVRSFALLHTMSLGFILLLVLC
jgi:hypothetical protein